MAGRSADLRGILRIFRPPRQSGIGRIQHLTHLSCYRVMFIVRQFHSHSAEPDFLAEKRMPDDLSPCKGSRDSEQKPWILAQESGMGIK